MTTERKGLALGGKRREPAELRIDEKKRSG